MKFLFVLSLLCCYVEHVEHVVHYTMLSLSVKIKNKKNKKYLLCPQIFFILSLKSKKSIHAVCADGTFIN